jgi:UrcA family protein
MTKGRIALFGSAMAVLLCGAGMASAQDYAYSNGPYNDAGYQPGNYDRSYSRGYDARDDRASPPVETVIVHPNDVIEERQVIGRVDGEVNPQAYNIQRPVDFSDLNLSRDADRAELHARIYQTASDLCAELDARVPGLAGDRSADRECVRNATRQALQDVYG